MCFIFSEGIKYPQPQKTGMKPELLAPAGSFEALKAAVANGADAVYFGGEKFNARRSAENFPEPQMRKAIAYAQSNNVKAYIAANTLVKNSELEEAARFLKSVYEAGADAVIIQDLGLMAMSRELFPGMEIHASTQMCLTNSKAISIAESLGASRAILPREFSLEEIKQARKQTNIPLEYFVQGAMCFSYSGQCLMSSMIQNRSANRGLCAQFCRTPYILTPGDKTGHLLSMKDLSLGGKLKELADAGISSLKIEGRLKSPEYVAVAVNAYRKAIDTGEYDETEIGKVFTRGFCEGYLHGKEGKTSLERPDNQGVLLGTISAYDHKKKTATLKLLVDLNIGDSIRVSASKGELVFDARQQGKKGHTIELKVSMSCNGVDVYKLYDKNLMEAAKKSYSREKAKAEPVQKRTAQGFEEKLSILLNETKARRETKILVLVADEEAAKTALAAGAAQAITDKEIAPAIIKDKELERYKACVLSGNLATGEYADYQLNVTNRLTVKTLAHLGFKRACISVELSRNDLAGFSNDIELEYIAHGRTVLMTSEHCFFRENCRKQCQNASLTDRIGFEFPLRSKDCRIQVLNSKILALFDKANELNGKVDFIRLDLREEKEDIGKLVTFYKEALSGRLSKESMDYKKSLDMSAFTLGHYNKDLA